MKCIDCQEGIVERERAGQEVHIIIFCEHKKFVVPKRVVDGLDNYLDELPDNWTPDVCPLREVE